MTRDVQRWNVLDWRTRLLLQVIDVNVSVDMSVNVNDRCVTVKFNGRQVLLLYMYSQQGTGEYIDM